MSSISTNSFALIPSPTAKKVGGVALVAGGAATTALGVLGAKSIIVIGIAAHAIPIVGIVIGVAMIILGACLLYHAWQSERATARSGGETPASELGKIPIQQIDLSKIPVQQPEPTSQVEPSKPPVQQPEPTSQIEPSKPPTTEPIVPTPQEETLPPQEVPEKLAFTFSDKLMAASNAVQWGLIGAAQYGIAPAITVPISLAAGIASQAANFMMLPKDASWLRWALTSPIVTNSIVSRIPIMGPIAKAASLYNLAQHALPKISEAWGELKSNPVGALKSGALHLFNLASGVAFAAESAGLIRLSPPDQPKQDDSPPFSEKDYCPFEKPSCENAKPHPSTYRKITIGSIYEDNGNKDIKEIAGLVDATHKEYAERWGLIHEPVVTTRAYLRDKCTDPTTKSPADCSPYWPKIPAMLDWINKHPPSEKEELLMMIDYDGPITNMTLDPHLLVQKWRGNNSANVIVTKDAEYWTPNNFGGARLTSDHNMNGGFWVLDNTSKAKNLLERVWAHRNTVHDANNPICKTWGMCQNQDCLHEQQATIQVMIDDPSLIEKGVLRIIPQRDPVTGVGVNTSNRGGCFKRIQKGFYDGAYAFTKDDPGTQWQPGDLMGQPNGVPPTGQEGPMPSDGNGGCSIDPSTPITKPRLERIKNMTSSIVR